MQQKVIIVTRILFTYSKTFPNISTLSVSTPNNLTTSSPISHKHIMKLRGCGLLRTFTDISPYSSLTKASPFFNQPLECLGIHSSLLPLPALLLTPFYFNVNHFFLNLAPPIPQPPPILTQLAQTLADCL